MAYPYTSPHDNPFFGPDPRDSELYHCAGKHCEIDDSLDEDDQEHCSEDEYCTCSCEDCKELVKQIREYDDGPEYDKYSEDYDDY